MSVATLALRAMSRPRRRSQQRALAIAFGLLAAVVAAVAREFLVPVVGEGLTFLTILPAVAVAAWAAGFLGGTTAVLVSLLRLYLQYLHPLNPATQGDEIGRLFVFGVSGLVISALGGQLNKSRAAAEKARAQARFLSDASAVLSERLDPMATAEALTRVAIPRFADRCEIDLFDDGGRFVDARVYASDPKIVALALALRSKYPYEADAPTGIPAVLRTGLPEYALQAPAGPRAHVEDPERRRMLEGLRFRSYISVPLSVPDGRRIGVLTVVMSDSGRTFTAEDVAVALDLGRRAGVALDHAALFGEVIAHKDELDAVIRVMEDPVLVAGPDGRIRSHNRAADRVLGKVAHRNLGEVLDELVPTPGHPTVRRVPATGRYVVPTVFDAPAGRSTVRIAVLRDTTDLLENEAARDAFIGMLSHELRTPITTIFGTAQMLRRPLDRAKRDDLLDDLAAETDRLYRLVEDLLVLSRFERGRLEIAAEPVQIQRVVNTALARAASMYPALQVSVIAPDPLPLALADTTYVEQLIRNLISNAVKYAGETARIDVRVWAEGGIVHVEFEDDGPGIPEHSAERVFGLYERLGESAFKPGAGIGLFVCRRLAEAMGGTMQVRRGPLGGACFHFTLPALLEEAPPARHRPSLYEQAKTQVGDSQGAAPGAPEGSRRTAPGEAALWTGSG